MPRIFACAALSTLIAACGCNNNPDRCANIECATGKMCNPDTGLCEGGAGGGSGTAGGMTSGGPAGGRAGGSATAGGRAGGVGTAGGSVAGGSGTAGGGVAGGSGTSGGGFGTSGGLNTSGGSGSAGGGANGGGIGTAGGGSNGGGTGTAGGGSTGGSNGGGIGTAGGGSTAGGIGTGGGSTAGGVGTGGGIGTGGGSAGLIGDRCQTAPNVGSGVIMSSTVGYTNDYANTNQQGCQGTAGLDRVYSVNVGPGQRVIASVDPAGAPFDPSISMVLGPAMQCDASPRVCVSSDDSGGTQTINFASWSNTGMTSQEVMIIVDGFASNSSGTYNLTVDVGAAPAGDTCATARALTAGATTAATLTGFADDNAAGTCSSTFGYNPDGVWAITIPAGQVLTVNVTPSAAHDTVISVMPGGSTCTGMCLQNANNGGTGATDTLTFANPGMTPLAVNVVVTGQIRAAGALTYTILATLGSAAIGDTCAGPQPLTPGVTVMASLAGYLNDPHATGPSCGPNEQGPDAWWSLTVPGGERALITVVPTGMDTALTLTTASCTPMGCLANGDNFGTGAIDSVSWTNPSTSPQQIYIVVDTFTGAGAYTIRADVGPPPAGDTCANAQPLATTGMPVNATLTGFADDQRSNGPSCFNTAGPDAVWSATIPPGERLTVVVTPSGTLNTVLSLIPTPAANCNNGSACLVSANTGANGQPDTLVYTNTSMIALPVLLAVDSTGAASALDYTISATLAAPPGGETCSTATMLGLPDSRPADDTASYVDDYQFGTNCAFSNSADRVYSVSVPSNTRATFLLQPTTGVTARLSLVETATCTATGMTCASSSGFVSPGQQTTLAYDNVSTSTRQLFAIVDSPGGAYSISTTSSTPNTGDLCQTAPAAITASTAFSDTLTGFVDNYNTTTGSIPCRFVAGPDRVYAFTLPAGRRLTVTVIASGSWDPALTLVDSPATNCDRPATCLAGTNVTGIAETLRYSNVGATTQDLFLVVDGNAAAAGFDLSAVIDNAPPPPTGDVCAVAPPAISTNTVLTMQTTAGYANDYFSPSCGNKNGADRTYAVSIPAGLRMNVTVSTTSAWDPALGFVVGAASACTNGTCAVQSDGPGSVSETLRYVNSGATALDGFIIVDSFSAAQAGSYDITFAFDMPPADDTCSSAQTPISTNTTLTGHTTVGFSNDYSAAGCGFKQGADRAYAVNIPAGQRLRVTVTGTTTAWNPALGLVLGPATACAAGACTVQSDVLGGTTETLTYVNAGATAAPGFIIVDTGPLNSSGAYDIAFVFDTPPPPPPGDTCASAPVLIAGTLTMQTTNGLNNDYSPDFSSVNCTGFDAPGLDRTFLVTVPGGQQLTVTVTPTGPGATIDDPALYLLPSPASSCVAVPMMCLAGADTGVQGDPETVVWRNMSMSPTSVYLIVDAFTGSLQEFTMVTTIAP